MTTPSADERAAVYRFYAADDTLLYVGITQRLGTRWANHAKKKPWWSQVARQSVDWYDTRAEALKVEEEAIKTSKPVHNIQHIPKPPKPPRPESEERRAQHRHAHKQRILRGIPDEEVADFDAAASQAGSNRSNITRQLWAWFAGRPGAELPPRPDPAQRHVP